MNSFTRTVRCGAHALLAAASLLFVLRSAAAVEPAAAEQRPVATKAQVPATVSTAESEPRPRPNVPIGAASAVTAPAQPPAVDWGFTPRRSAAGRRR